MTTVQRPADKTGRREKVHYRVALLLANGARIRAVCRVTGCDWRSEAYLYKPTAELARTDHQLDHAKRAERAASSRPVTPAQGATS